MKRLTKIKYLENNQVNGIDYDWKLIRKALKVMGIPKEYFNPSEIPWEKVSWIDLLSQRSTGKTTGILILGLVMYWLYGTVLHYCRGTEKEIAPKVSKSMYDVILDNKYIEILTDGEYNSLKYWSRKWYFCHVDENGEIDNVDEHNCTFMCSVDRAGDLKSSHNSPTGDLIVYDEHIPIGVRCYCDFVPFCDLCKTIFRDRVAGKIILLANTINKENQYFHELEIYERISEMDIGDNCIHTTDKGTNIYIEIVGTPRVLKSRKKLFNRKFLGFRNSQLSGITGETTWSIKNYPHIPDEEYENIYNKIYISHNNKLLRLDLVTNNRGLCLYVHWASKLYDDSLICVPRTPVIPQEHYGIADDTSFGRLFKQLSQARKIYFASNDVGSFMQNYLNQCKINLPLM